MAEGSAALGLSLIALTLIAWFPGHNATRHAHSSPARVRAVAWGLILAGAWLVVAGYDPMKLMPGLTTLWVAIAIWSYGRRPSRPDACLAGGFEVTLAVPAEQSMSNGTPVVRRRVAVVVEGEAARAGCGYLVLRIFRTQARGVSQNVLNLTLKLGCGFPRRDRQSPGASCTRKGLQWTY